MASKSSTPVYISNDSLTALEKWSKTPEGKKLGMTDPKKVVNYVLQKFLGDQT